MAEAARANPPSQVLPVVGAGLLLAAAVVSAEAWFGPLGATATVACGTLGLLAAATTVLGRPPRAALVLLDAIVLVAFVAGRDPNARLWSQPGTWPDITHLTPIGSATMVLIYGVASLVALQRLRRHLAPREQFAVLLVPVLFNLALLLGADPLTQGLGRAVTFGLAAPAWLVGWRVPPAVEPLTARLE